MLKRACRLRFVAMPVDEQPRNEDQPGLGISSGLRAFAGGIGFVVGTPSVWGYALVPITVGVVLACGLSILGFWGSAYVSNSLFASSTGFWGQVGSWALTLLLALPAVLVAILLSLCLAQPLSGFALEAMVSARERALTGWSGPRPGIVESTLRGTQVALFTLAVAVPVFAVLMLVTFMFPPAAIVTVPLKFFVYAWLLAWNFLDYPLGMHRLGLQARVRWVLQHFDAFCAFGLLWAVLGLVPGIVLLLLPMGVAGATQLVVEAEYKSAAPP
jgi:CysZ protein